MSYGYESSQPNLTLNLNPEQLAAGRQLAAALGYLQTRGATAGQGSLSALVSALADAAHDQGPRRLAYHLRWTAKITPAARWQNPTPLLVQDPTALPHLAKAAKQLGLVRATGPRKRIGEGSVNALVAAIAQAADDEGAQAIAHRLKWIKA